MRPTHSSLKPAVLLGLLALAPFAAGVYYAYAGNTLDAASALRWLAPYLATIIGFIGGVQWGRMLSKPGGATGADRLGCIAHVQSVACGATSRRARSRLACR